MVETKLLRGGGKLSHRWQLSLQEPHINREECSVCHAVQFSPAYTGYRGDIPPELQPRIKELNRTLGKECDCIMPRVTTDHTKDKEAILAEYGTIKLTDFLRHWHMSSVTWQKLKTDWKVTDKGRGSHATRSKPPPAPPAVEEKASVGKKLAKEKPVRPAATELPIFPDFKDSWPEATQCRWLDCYLELRLKDQPVKAAAA